MKHTPGPWIVKVARTRLADTDDVWVESRAPELKGKAFRQEILEDGDYPTKLADARLISKSPEMNDWIESALSVLSDVDTSSDPHLAKAVAQLERVGYRILEHIKGKP